MRTLIETTLCDLRLHSPEAVELLLGTCAQESAMGKYRRQVGGGPALGIFQCEPQTFNDIIDNYLRHRPALYGQITKLSGLEGPQPEDLLYNDVLAICICRVHYLRVKEAIPQDLEGQAWYWKQYYNTQLGKGTIGQYISNYNKYVAKGEMA